MQWHTCVWYRVCTYPLVKKSCVATRISHTRLRDVYFPLFPKYTGKNIDGYIDITEVQRFVIDVKQLIVSSAPYLRVWNICFGKDLNMQGQND